jgi:hypothetical protein
VVPIRRSEKEPRNEILDEVTMCNCIINFLVIEEIEERKKFLQEMCELGCGSKYEQQIKNEIMIRLKRLKEVRK